MNCNATSGLVALFCAFSAGLQIDYSKAWTVSLLVLAVLNLAFALEWIP